MAGGRSTPIALRDVLQRLKFILYFAVFFSFLYNILRLTGPLFMILIYDRVLPSRSEATLVALFLLVVTFLAAMAMLDYSRRRILARFGAQFQEYVENHIFERTERDASIAKSGGKPKDGLDELDKLRGFFHSSALVAILDFLWCPIFLIAIFLISAVIGWVVVGGIALVFVLIVLKTVFAKDRTDRFEEASNKIRELKEMLIASRDVIRSQQMTTAYNERWVQARRRSRDRAVELNDWKVWFSTLSTHTAMLLQYSVLAAGAYLALNDRMTIGAMVACMFLSVRVFYPVERFTKEYPRLREAIADWRSLDRTLKTGESLPPAPEVRVAAALSLTDLTVRSPLTKQKLLRVACLEIEPGATVEIVGKSGSGKTLLAETILGRIPRSGGKILVNGIDIEGLSLTYMAGAFGYVPQQVAFVNGTIEENISGLKLNVDRARLVEVSKLAQIHDMIIALPDGYGTPIDAAGSCLSKGERHQIALARALYSNPKVLIVDEPDQTFREGLSRHLKAGIASHLNRGGILIILSRLALKTFRPARRFSLEDGQLTECTPTQNGLVRSMSNVVTLSDQQIALDKIGKETTRVD